MSYRARCTGRRLARLEVRRWRERICYALGIESEGEFRKALRPTVTRFRRVRVKAKELNALFLWSEE